MTIEWRNTIMDDMALIGALGLAVLIGIFFKAHLLDKKTTK